MSRILSLVLIVVSGWMLYLASYHFSGVETADFAETFGHALDDKDFLFPFLGGVLGMLGGISVFLGGPGGATISFCGGLIATGYALSGAQSILVPDLAFWDNPTMVALAMVGIAIIAAVTRTAE